MYTLSSSSLESHVTNKVMKVEQWRAAGANVTYVQWAVRERRWREWCRVVLVSSARSRLVVCGQLWSLLDSWLGSLSVNSSTARLEPGQHRPLNSHSVPRPNHQRRSWCHRRSETASSSLTDVSKQTILVQKNKFIKAGLQRQFLPLVYLCQTVADVLFFTHLHAIRQTIYISLIYKSVVIATVYVWRVHAQRDGNWLQLQINNELKLVRWGSRAAWPHRYICQY